MAKRKAAGTVRRKSTRQSTGSGRKRAAARTTPRRKSAAKKAARKKPAARKAAKSATARRRPVTPKKQRARRIIARARKVATPQKPAKRRPAAAAASRTAVATRKPPALDRARRIVQGDDIVPTPPSSLNMDRSASAARTGRRELRERLDEHTETSPALTAGDVDADWESAYSVGDEAPGGDNPTPDQDVVDDIGRAVGVQYNDNEELKGEAKITKRDKHRWELDPASSEDYDER
jgi:uncharacterized protein DUF6335